MKTIQYDGFELEHFDSAYNFRKYQVLLIKKYLKGKFLEVGAGTGGLAHFYKKFVIKPTFLPFKYKQSFSSSTSSPVMKGCFNCGLIWTFPVFATQSNCIIKTAIMKIKILIVVKNVFIR